jgi:hypothetical protein
MVDTIHFYNKVKQDQEPTGLSEPGYEEYDEVFIEKNPSGTSSKKKRYLLDRKIDVNESYIKDKSGSQRVSNCFVNVSSLSYVLNAKTNLATVGPRSLKRALKELDSLLKNKGIQIDVYNALLSRLDLTVTIKVSRPMAFYFPLLRTLQPKGYEKHEHDGRNLTFKENEAHSIIIYDKLFELEKKHSLQPAKIRAEYGMKKDEHLMRFEFQYRSSYQIYKHLGIKTVSELVKQRFHIKKALKAQIEGLFGRVDQSSKVTTNTLLAYHKFLSQQGKLDESLVCHYHILLNCNENIEEALQLICTIKRKHSQRFKLRTRHKLHRALEFIKQDILTQKKDQYAEILKAIETPIWLSP